MPKNTNPIAYTAADELDRRSSNKGLAKADKVGAPDSPEGARLLAMTGEALRAEANLPAKPVKAANVTPAKPAKPARTEVQVKHTRLREQAFAYRNAQYKAGVKVSWTDAYAKFGTAPASVTNAPGFAG